MAIPCYASDLRAHLKRTSLHDARELVTLVLAGEERVPTVTETHGWVQLTERARLHEQRCQPRP